MLKSNRHMHNRVIKWSMYPIVKRKRPEEGISIFYACEQMSNNLSCFIIACVSLTHVDQLCPLIRAVIKFWFTSNILKSLTNLLLYDWIVSTTGKFTLNIKGLSCILSTCSMCYRLCPFLIALQSCLLTNRPFATVGLVTGNF